MSQSSDKQYVALAGQPNGRVELVDYRSPNGPLHRLLREAGDLTPGRIELGDIIPPTGWDGQDSLKISGLEYFTVVAYTVVGGSEDVVDINHSHNVKIFIDNATPLGSFVTTLKGGSTNIQLSIGHQTGHGSETDYDIGNYSQQSKNPSVGVSIYVGTVLGGSKPLLRVGNADYPKLSGVEFKYQWFASLLLKAYVWFKNTFIWPN